MEPLLQPPTHAPIILAVDDEPLRARLAAILAAAGIEPAACGGSAEAVLTPASVADRALIVLETGDDVAHLVQIVNNLYRSPFHTAGGSQVICVVSALTFSRNQWLGFWLIDGHAALFAVWTPEMGEWERLPQLAQEMARWRGRDPAPSRPAWEELVEAIRAHPENGGAWFDLAKLMMDWPGIHDVRPALAAPMLRQAIQLQPKRAGAHFLLGRALQWLGNDEEATAEAETAIRLEPYWAEPHSLLADLLYGRGDRARARAEFELAAQLDTVGTTGRWARMALEQWDW
jgi:tetratricopeptide (TPR) repeat protein